MHAFPLCRSRVCTAPKCCRTLRSRSPTVESVFVKSSVQFVNNSIGSVHPLPPHPQRWLRCPHKVTLGETHDRIVHECAVLPFTLAVNSRIDSVTATVCTSFECSPLTHTQTPHFCPTALCTRWHKPIAPSRQVVSSLAHDSRHVVERPRAPPPPAAFCLDGMG
jgi:hypothetical protein